MCCWQAVLAFFNMTTGTVPATNGAQANLTGAQARALSFDAFAAMLRVAYATARPLLEAVAAIHHRFAGVCANMVVPSPPPPPPPPPPVTQSAAAAAAVTAAALTVAAGGINTIQQREVAPARPGEQPGGKAGSMLPLAAAIDSPRVSLSLSSPLSPHVLASPAVFVAGGFEDDSFDATAAAAATDDADMVDDVDGGSSLDHTPGNDTRLAAAAAQMRATMAPGEALALLDGRKPATVATVAAAATSAACYSTAGSALAGPPSSAVRDAAVRTSLTATGVPAVATAASVAAPAFSAAGSFVDGRTTFYASDAERLVVASLGIVVDMTEQAHVFCQKLLAARTKENVDAKVNSTAFAGYFNEALTFIQATEMLSNRACAQFRGALLTQVAPTSNRAVAWDSCCSIQCNSILFNKMLCLHRRAITLSGSTSSRRRNWCICWPTKRGNRAKPRPSTNGFLIKCRTMVAQICPSQQLSLQDTAAMASIMAPCPVAIQTMCAWGTSRILP